MRFGARMSRSEEHTSELQSPKDLVCRLLLEEEIGLNENELNQYSDSTHKSQADMISAVESLKKKIPARIDLRPALFFFNDTATTEIYTLSLHDALPISGAAGERRDRFDLVHEPLARSGL